MVTNIDNRQDAAKAGLRGKLPRVRGSGPLEWGQAKAKDAKKRILRPDYTNEMFVYTSGPHKLLEDTVKKKSYEMSDTSIIAAVVAECVRMRSATAHRTADYRLHIITSAEVLWSGQFHPQSPANPANNKTSDTGRQGLRHTAPRPEPGPVHQV